VIEVLDSAAQGTELPEREPIPAAVIAEGDGRQWGRRIVDEPALGLSAGIWESGAFRTRPFVFGGHEFMRVLEGEIVLEADGGTVRVGPGEAAVVAQGATIAWTQPRRVRKLFMRFDDPGLGLGLAETPAPGIVRIEAAAPLEPSPGPGADVLLTPPPATRSSLGYADPTGRFSAGVWSATPYERRPTVCGHYELMAFLDGAAAFTGDGEFAVADGGAVFLSPGTRFGWRSSVPVTKFYCSFTPP
jgi:uncharacterized cupin superfamily protein